MKKFNHYFLGYRVIAKISADGLMPSPRKTGVFVTYLQQNIK